MEEDMTDETREIFDEENEPAFAPTDALAEEAEPSDQAIQDLTDTEEELAEEPDESPAEEQEPAPPAGEATVEDEPALDQVNGTTEETVESGPGQEQEVSELPNGTAATIPEQQVEGPLPQEPETAPAEQPPTIESVVEAILFATDEPLTESRLADIVETTTKQVRESIKSLNARYEANNSAFRIEQIAGGYQMLTMSIYNNWLKKMLRARSDSRLSPAAMETLAIIAYKQPIIRADIEAIRGVAVGEVIRSLMYKGLVKIVGRAEILGRPMLYGTTKKFLEVFGLNSLKDLPKAEELKNPDRG
jgi:segregation and condensation protein B